MGKAVEVQTGTGLVDEAAKAGQWLPLDVARAAVQALVTTPSDGCTVVKYGSRLFVQLTLNGQPATTFEVAVTYPQQSTVSKVLEKGTVVSAVKRSPRKQSESAKVSAANGSKVEAKEAATVS